MKLTNLQVAQIEETLVLNGLDYEDLKLEVTDHIATEIEVLLESNTLSFGENLKSVFEKWKPQLQPASSRIWLGPRTYVPKIILDKLIIESKKELFQGILVVIILTFLLILTSKFFKDITVIKYMVVFLQALSLTGVFILVLGKIYRFKAKTKTTYSLLFTRIFYLMLFYGIGIGIGIYPILPSGKSAEIKVFSLSFALLYLIIICNMFRSLYKHFQFEKKLSISNS
jgi:hypothetical protein